MRLLHREIGLYYSFILIYDGVIIHVSCLVQILNKCFLFYAPGDRVAYVLVGTESHGHLLI